MSGFCLVPVPPGPAKPCSLGKALPAQRGGFHCFSQAVCIQGSPSQKPKHSSRAQRGPLPSVPQLLGLSFYILFAQLGESVFLPRHLLGFSSSVTSSMTLSRHLRFMEFIGPFLTPGHSAWISLWPTEHPDQMLTWTLTAMVGGFIPQFHALETQSPNPVLMLFGGEPFGNDQAQRALSSRLD